MGLLFVYLVGYDDLKKLLFVEEEKAVKEEIARRKISNKGWGKEFIQDTPGTINNRINQMEKELKRMKVVISVEKDTISLEARKREKAKIPKYVRKINKRMQSYNPKLKLYKSEPKAQKKTLSLREHYESWNGKVGGEKRVQKPDEI